MTATGIEISHLICTLDFGKEVVPVEILIVWIVDLMGNVTGNCDKYGKLKYNFNLKKARSDTDY